MNDKHYIENDELRLRPQSEHFPIPEKLKRAENDELHTSRWNELCIGMAESCLTDEEAALVYSWIKEDEASRQQVATYQKLILKTDKGLTFSEKKMLKQRDTGHVAWISSVAAAAVIVMLFTIYTFRNEQQTVLPDTITNTVTIAAITNITDTSPAIDSTINTQKAVSPEKELKTVTRTIPATTKQEEIIQEQKDSVVPVIPQPRILQPDIKRLPARQPVLLANVEPVGAMEIVLPLSSQHDITSATSIVPVKVKTFFDQLAKNAIVGVNRVLNTETVVIKEYNPEGELTYLAVQSELFNMERFYHVKQESKQ